MSDVAHRLRDRAWKTKYDSDTNDLVGEFFLPALEAAVRYDRSTGFFSAGALQLASRGLEGLARRGGKMRLVVGCTLEQPEVRAIQEGLALRATIEARLRRQALAAETPPQQEALALLAWMVKHEILEIRIAVPCTADRMPCAGDGLFHEKAGVLEDAIGDRLAFNGSLNETAAAWGTRLARNWESFHVFTGWTPGGSDHVEDEVVGFEKLWNDKSRYARTVDLPEAIRDDLLRFLPPHDEKPRRIRDDASVEMQIPVELTPAPLPPTSVPSRPAQVAMEEKRRRIWSVIRQAPAWDGAGARVGEATSAVVPWPHQIRAFDRLYAKWPPRLLIADEVGLGKTIQAGLLLRQAWLSGRARRILVLAPKAVLSQWQIELREKFNLDWPIYDGSVLRWPASQVHGTDREREVNPEEWHQEPCVITSSHLMRRSDRAPDLLEIAKPYDLVVLDEAHHARRRNAGLGKGKGPNQLLRLMQGLKARTKGLVLLTATPMQVHPVEVWDLLSLLGLPPEWDERTFERFFDLVSIPNPSHEALDEMARLFRVVESTFGETPLDAVMRLTGLEKVAAGKILKALRDADSSIRRRGLSTEYRRAALQVLRANTPVSRLISRHTRELLRRYRKTGKLSTHIAERAVDDDFVTLSPAERRVYEAVEEYISSTYNQSADKERNAVGFVMTIYRRRLASSFAALRATLESRLDALRNPPGRIEGDEEDVLDDEVGDDLPDADEAARLERQALIVEEAGDIERLVEEIRGLPTDTKARRLVEQLRTLRASGVAQTIVFTQFTDTMDFLRSHLRANGFSVMCFSGRGGEVAGLDGRWTTVSRDDVKTRFRNRKAEILVATDAAAEGLNLQFCAALVNYDMPWNPMRVEQRIGRIDRLGQEHPVVRIINLHYEDTVETDVYQALRSRIRLFSQFVGKLQPILAKLPGSLAKVTRARPGELARERADLVSEIHQQIDQQEQEGFDLDAVTDADLEEPPRPSAAYDLDDLDALIRQPGLLPAGVAAVRLGGRQFSVTVPGLKEAVRVTTCRCVYEQNPGSLELWSPGSPIFPAPPLGPPANSAADTAEDATADAFMSLRDLLRRT